MTLWKTNHIFMLEHFLEEPYVVVHFKSTK